MAGLLPVRTVADGRGRTLEGARRDGGEAGGREGREGSVRRTAGGREAGGERARRDDPVALPDLPERRSGPRGGELPRAPAVWPCARPCAVVRPSRERFHGCCVGRPTALDSVGWGTLPPHSPQAADRSGRRTAPPGPCAEPVGGRRGEPVAEPVREPVRSGCGSGPTTLLQNGIQRCIMSGSLRTQRPMRPPRMAE